MSKIAEALGVSVEELVMDTESRASMTEPLLVRAFHNAQMLDEQDKQVLIHIVNAFITRKKVERALTPDR
jgi:hypothetical protein